MSHSKIALRVIKFALPSGLIGNIRLLWQLGHITKCNLIKESAMKTVTIRKQYGDAIVTIPREMLIMLNIGVGSKLDFDVSDGVLMIRPAAKSRRYPITEILQGSITA